MAALTTQGTGTILTFVTSGFAASLLEISGPSIKRDTIDISNMATTLYLVSEPVDLADPGELTAKFVFDPSLLPPIHAAAETITINWAGKGAGNTWSFSGYMTAYEPSAMINQRMEASATIKLAGAVSLV